MHTETELALAACLNGTMFTEDSLAEADLKMTLLGNCQDWFANCPVESSPFNRERVLADIREAKHDDLILLLGCMGFRKRPGPDDTYVLEDEPWKTFVDIKTNEWRHGQ